MCKQLFIKLQSKHGDTYEQTIKGKNLREALYVLESNDELDLGNFDQIYIEIKQGVKQ